VRSGSGGLPWQYNALEISLSSAAFPNFSAAFSNFSAAFSNFSAAFSNFSAAFSDFSAACSNLTNDFVDARWEF
jgi:hypothetical protein